MHDDKHNVSLDEIAVELELPVAELQQAIDAIRKRRNLKDGEPLHIEVPSERISPTTYLQQKMKA